MANPGEDPSSDLQGLFASLRSSNRQSYPANSGHDESQAAQSSSRQSYDLNRISNSPQVSQHDRQSSAVLSPRFSSPLNGSQSRDVMGNISMSKTGSPAPAGESMNTDRTANLLNLLKFSAPSASPHATPLQQSTSMLRPGYGSSSTHSVHGRGISASDVVGSSMGKPAVPPPPEKSRATSSTNHQDFLLKLLNQSNSAQPVEIDKDTTASPRLRDQETTADQITQRFADTSLGKQSHAASGDRDSTHSAREESPIRFFGNSENSQPTPFDPEAIPKSDTRSKKDSIFTYVNPFEQLAASSPRNVRSGPAQGDANKRKSEESSPMPVHHSSRRKLTPAGSEIRQSIESPAPTSFGDGPGQIEALMGIGAPSRNAGTVAEALNEVGGRVDREVGNALAKAEGMERVADIKKGELEQAQNDTLHLLEEKVQNAASEVINELDKEENKGLLEESMAAPGAEAIKDIIDEAAKGNKAVGWENADGEETPSTNEVHRVVPVYQFPLKPFVSLEIKQQDLSHLTIREESLLNIARLKKEFDQADRTLATATNDFIVYASPKTGGLRIIRQEDGSAKHLFPDTRDRISNVSISMANPLSPIRGTQNIIATGISGTVYWIPIARPNDDVFHSDMEEKSLIFPPSPAHSDNSSGGQLKTRAKKSSRHPEFFAIGRGKSIQIIFPKQTRGSDFLGRGNTVDTENYFRDRSLKITTGKAGKDFAFSEDDSTIVTLDKAGRLRFWDVRELIDESNASASRLAPVEIKTPISSFVTTPPTEKAWPTSVLYMDKLRPYIKGIALRYLVVGMKQNHTLQLWDFCLGKAVQELSFPHEKESDAICSIAYHPSSGMIVVGHPTRNSIYFIHLSAPRYHLPAMSQAKFMQRLANKDSTLPKPDATAIMSGMREYSFADKGELRSIELVPQSGEPTRIIEDEEDPVLFELYVMHSKGVTCLGVKKGDLGWSQENKVINPVDAEKEGYVVVKDLRESHAVPQSEPSSANGESLASGTTAAAPALKDLTKETGRSAPTLSAKSRDPHSEAAALPISSALNSKLLAPDSGTAASSSNTEKADKKKKKRAAGVVPADTPTRGEAEGSSAVNAPSFGPTSRSYTNAAQQPSLPSSQTTQHAAVPETEFQDISDPAIRATNGKPNRPIANGDSIDLGISGDFLDKERKKIEKSVSAEFNQVLNRELESLYRRFDEDKRVQDAAGAAKQDAMLRLVSSTLGDNVEKALARIIQAKIQQLVLPSIIDVTASTLDKSISETVTKQLHQIIPSLLKVALPEAMSRAVQNREVLRVISDQITSKLAGHVEKEFSATLHNTISPAFKSIAVDLASKISGETERRVREQLQKSDIQHREDSAKVDQLTSLVRGLSETVHTMAAAQSEFQNEILKLQQHAAQGRQANSSRDHSREHQHSSQTSNAPVVLHRSPEQEELEAISTLMTQCRYEECTIQWLQSDHQVDHFDNFLVRCDPAFIQQLSPLVSLSVGAAVTSSLEHNAMDRLIWLETVFATIDPRDPDIREVAPRIMDVLSQRLESQYMLVAEADPRDPVLRKIPNLAKQARELKAFVR